jgi:hypothetical protein
MSVDSFDSFIMFTDDYSRYGYIYQIKEKSKALDKFEIFKAEVENQPNQKIKVHDSTGFLAPDIVHGQRLLRERRPSRAASPASGGAYLSVPFSFSFSPSCPWQRLLNKLLPAGSSLPGKRRGCSPWIPTHRCSWRGSGGAHCGGLPAASPGGRSRATAPRRRCGSHLAATAAVVPRLDSLASWIWAFAHLWICYRFDSPPSNFLDLLPFVDLLLI